MSTDVLQKRRSADRFLSVIERAGNKLPDPFILFLLLFAVTAITSSFMAWSNVSIRLPGSAEPTTIRGLFTNEGLTWFTTNLGENFVGFPPLATVLTILFAVGVAEKSGLLAAMVRTAFGSAPPWALPYAVGAVGVLGSVMGDAAFIIIPPLAAMVFKASGRHPVAGLLGGFAAAGAGYSTNLFVTSLDAMFAGITSAVVEQLPQAGSAVTPISNYFFNAVASVVLMLLAGFIIDKILEPRLRHQQVPIDTEPEDSATLARFTPTLELNPELTAREMRGLKAAIISVAVVFATIAVVTILPDSPWRNEEGGFLPKSPLMSSVVFGVFLSFIVPGLVYGITVGIIKSGKDIPRLMTSAMSDMLDFLVLAFVLGQFVALFNWSGLGQWIAISGAQGLQAIGLTGYPAILAFILLASILNLFIISGSAMWTLLASAFVPMFALLGYEPAFIQAAFRVGDSATQVLTPMNPYMIVLLSMLRRYEPRAGLGTIVSRMLPFVIPFWVAWVLILSVFFFMDIPLGPGNGIHIQP